MSKNLNTLDFIDRLSNIISEKNLDTLECEFEGLKIKLTKTSNKYSFYENNHSNLNLSNQTRPSYGLPDENFLPGFTYHGAHNHTPPSPATKQNPQPALVLPELVNTTNLTPPNIPPPPPQETPQKEELTNLIKVKSPLVGIAYLSSAPGAKPFIEVGSKVKEGDVLLIIEAMKVMNPIKSPFSGTVKEILVVDSDPIEYDEVLVHLE